MIKDYYSILEVERDADEKAIKSSYRTLARKWHPDMNPDSPEAAEEKFKEISEAYAILSNPEKKALYDATGSVDPRMGGFRTTGDPFEIFRQHFEGGLNRQREPNPPMRGQSIRMALHVPLKEALFGGSQDIEYQVQSGCAACAGQGGTEFETCSSCEGSGILVQRRPGMLMQGACAKCHGQGKSVKSPCLSCSGRGITQEQKNLTVVIPSGVRHGNTMRLQGQGGAGFNGGPRGDVLIDVGVNYPDLGKLTEDEKTALAELLSR